MAVELRIHGGCCCCLRGGGQVLIGIPKLCKESKAEFEGADRKRERCGGYVLGDESDEERDDRNIKMRKI